MSGSQNKILIAFLMITSLSVAQIEPAMISEAELKALGTIPLKKDSNQTQPKKGEWRLDGILFNNDQDWTVWLNGESFTPNHLPVGIRIIQVCDESVHLCAEENDVPVKVLCLNQWVRFHA